MRSGASVCPHTCVDVTPDMQPVCAGAMRSVVSQCLYTGPSSRGTNQRTATKHAWDKARSNKAHCDKACGSQARTRQGEDANRHETNKACMRQSVCTDRQILLPRDVARHAAHCLRRLEVQSTRAYIHDQVGRAQNTRDNKKTQTGSSRGGVRKNSSTAIDKQLHAAHLHTKKQHAPDERRRPHERPPPKRTSSARPPHRWKVVHRPAAPPASRCRLTCSPCLRRLEVQSARAP
jgi:hypothetical protein